MALGRSQRSPGSPARPLRFRRSVVRDLRNGIRFALVGLLILIGLNVLAMMAFEHLGLGGAVWRTFTTITTTGYGDFSAKTAAGRASTIVLIYLSGIFLLTQAGSAFFEFRILRRERKRRGEWRWDMRDHIVFVNESTRRRARRLSPSPARSATPLARELCQRAVTDPD